MKIEVYRFENPNSKFEAASRVASEAYDYACMESGNTASAREFAYEELQLEHQNTDDLQYRHYLLAFMCIVSGATKRGNA